MPLGVSAYVALATNVIASSTSTVTFAGIPTSGYRDLVLVIDGTATSSSNILFRFNGDSGNNYSYAAMFGNGSSQSSFAEANISSITQAGLNTTISGCSIQIMDYSATDKHKSVFIQIYSQGAVQTTAARWASTSAINSLTLSPTTGGGVIHNLN